MDEFPVRTDLRIDWSEVDSFGHVNNLAIMRYVQTARVAYLESIGMMQAYHETGVGPVMASTSCQFRKQLFYPGTVTVRSRVEHVKNTSFHMRHVVCDEAQEPVAEAHDVIVLFDFRKGAKLRIPDGFRARMGLLPG